MKPPALKSRKITGLVLSGALLATQSLFAYEPEKNFWSERRRAVHRSSPVVLASLPQTFYGPNTLAAQFPAPQHVQSSITSSVARSVPKTFLTGHADLLAALSPAYGSVRKVSLGKNAGSSGPVVIHIQDVHMNAEAQKNIRETVAAMLKSGKVGLVALEGSTEDIALQPFVDFPNRKAVELTADYLLKENKISGPIHAAMTAQGKLPRILGIDDPVHYAANVQAYKDSAPKLEETRMTIRKRRGELEEQKKAVFSPALLALDQIVTGYRNDKVSLGDYMEALVGSYSVVAPFMERPYLKSFLQALKTERTLDFKQVESERSQLIEKLSNSLNTQEINALMAQSLAYRTGELRYGDFYTQLKETCRKKGIRLSDYPAVDDYVRYVLLCDGIDAEQLLNEIAALEKAAYEALSKTPEEKELVAQSRQAWLTSKLVEFSLTPPEWKEYRGREGNLEGEELPLSTRDPAIASFKSFYQEAESRDTSMAQNLLSALDLQSKSSPATPPIALLVTGGFHAEGMAKQLTEKGATVISHVPKINKIDTSKGSAYLSVFTQEKTPLEKLFQGEKLFLSPNMAIGAQKIAPFGVIGMDSLLDGNPNQTIEKKAELLQFLRESTGREVDVNVNIVEGNSEKGMVKLQVNLNGRQTNIELKTGPRFEIVSIDGQEPKAPSSVKAILINSVSRLHRWLGPLAKYVSPLTETLVLKSHPAWTGINLKDRRRLLVSLLLAFVPLGPVWASGLGVLPEQRYLPIYIRHAIPADILPFEEVIKKAILKNAEEGRTIVFALENGGFGSQEIVQAARETTLDINKWKNIFEETQLRIKNGGVSEEVAKYFSSRNTFQEAIWRLIYWAKNQKIKTKIIFEEPEFDLFEMEVHGVKLLIEANDAFLSGDFSRTVHLLEQNFRYSLEAVKCRDEKYHKKLDHSLNDPSNFVIDLRGAAHRPRFDIPFEIREIGLQVNNPFGTSHLLVLEREGLSVEKTERERQLISTVVAGTILTYLHSSLGALLGALPKAEQELEMIKEILDNLSLDDYKAISSKAGSMVKGNAKNVRVGIGITAVVDWLKRNNKIPPRYLPYFQNIKISENARNQSRATSLWGLKFAEWLGSTTGGVAGRERFGAGYRRFAAFIEWGVSAKAAFWGVMGTMAFAGSPVGWAVAPAMGMVYGILFFGSHFIPKSMAPVTKVKVGVFEALALGMFYGVLIGVTPFLLGVVPFMGVPEFGVQMAGVLWGLTGFLHSSFDREKPREAGERAAWNLVGQLASIHGVFETVMPGIQSDHTDQIVGKGGLSADSLSTILARFKNDVEFREGFVGAIQKEMEKGGLSSAQMNLLSVLVKGATGQPIAFLHVLGKTPLVELAKLETLSGQVNSPEKGGFTMALVVPFGQTEGVNFRVASLKAKGVQIFEVNLGPAGWNVETLSTLEGQMSSWLGRANGIVATVGSEVGIKPTDVEALDSESRLRAALKTAVTLGESIQNFLRYLQVLASNA